MKRATKISIVVVALIAVAAMCVWLRWRQSVETVRVVAAQANRSRVVSNQNSSAVATPRSSEAVSVDDLRSGSRVKFLPSSVPSPQLPLVQTYAELKRESQAGNYLASCRIAAALTRCQLVLPLAREKMDALLSQRHGVQPESDAYQDLTKRIGYAQKTIAETAPICDGFVNIDGAKAWQYALTAGLQGHIPSMVWFGMFPAFDPREGLANVDAWAAYHQYGRTFLEAGASVGDRGALWALIEYLSAEPIHIGDFNIRLRMLPADPEQAAMYANAVVALDRALKPNADTFSLTRLEKAEKNLTPEQRELARQRAYALVSSWDSKVLQPPQADLPDAERSESHDVCLR